MEQQKISWEIILCGLMMTSMAIMLANHAPSSGSASSANLAPAFSIPLPTGPSCDATLSAPQSLDSKIQRILKDHRITLKSTNGNLLKKQTQIRITNGENGDKKVIIITPKGKEVRTISG
jgi:hypothetical protein